jgi:hypothetical protein
MNFVRLLPVLLAFLLLGAHFLRANLTWPAYACLVPPLLLLVRRPWVVRVIQVLLLAGALEWLRTTIVLVSSRRSAGESWTRLALILGAVVAFTLGSTLVFGSGALRKRYGPGQDSD